LSRDARRFEASCLLAAKAACCLAISWASVNIASSRVRAPSRYARSAALAPSAAVNRARLPSFPATVFSLAIRLLRFLIDPLERSA
jgi:hypothetical protein